VRTYPLTRDRVDQDLTAGNRGFVKGEAPAGNEKERKTTRTTQVVEVELHSPIRFEKLPEQKMEKKEKAPIKITEDKEIWGNRGFITQSQTPEIIEPEIETQVVKTEQYKVQKGDTLQKISKKFYGTTKKWAGIYKANKDTLKGPDKIYPGQVLNLPVESLRETPENLK
jgi:nucleoid-associated protein YgaU